ncbi:MAG: hypothetical protein AAGB24_00115 [Bacteroidota bacterium]
MNIEYQKWLTLKLSNTYFPEAIFSRFRFLPFLKTGRLLKNYQVLIDKKENTVSLYVGTSAFEDVDFKTQLSGLGKLLFLLKTTDDSFYSYTDVGAAAPHGILFFNSGTLKGYPIELQRDSYVSAQDYIAYRPKNFMVSVPEGKAEIQIKNEAETIVFSKTIDNTQQKQYAVNLVGQPNGVYRMDINGRSTAHFFCCDDLGADCIGVWQLDVAAFLEAKEYPLVFNLDFAAREVHWQYEVMLGASRKMEIQEMNVKGAAGESYTGPEEKTVLGNRKAQVYTSDSPQQLQLQLADSPQLQLSYTTDFSDRPQELEIKLPNPASGQLGKYTNGPNKGAFYATSFVYV